MSSEFDVQAGSIDVSGDLRGKTKIDCQAGSVNLYLQDKENQYGYQIKNEVGSVELGEQDYSGLSNEISVRNDAKNQLDIDCHYAKAQSCFGSKLLESHFLFHHMMKRKENIMKQNYRNSLVI